MKGRLGKFDSPSRQETSINQSVRLMQFASKDFTFSPGATLSTLHIEPDEEKPNWRKPFMMLFMSKSSVSQSSDKITPMFLPENIGKNQPAWRCCAQGKQIISKQKHFLFTLCFHYGFILKLHEWRTFIHVVHQIWNSLPQQKWTFQWNGQNYYTIFDASGSCVLHIQLQTKALV